MEEDNVLVLEPLTKDENVQYMADLSMNSPLFNPFDFDKLVYNDQGTANWYRRLYPGFPDHFYDIFELYSIDGIRVKQFKSHLKKLKKKGKFKNDEKTPECVVAFGGTNACAEEFKKVNIED